LRLDELGLISPRCILDLLHWPSSAPFARLDKIDNAPEYLPLLDVQAARGLLLYRHIQFLGDEYRRTRR
jgi:hypothetical protein